MAKEEVKKEIKKEKDLKIKESYNTKAPKKKISTKKEVSKTSTKTKISLPSKSNTKVDISKNTKTVTKTKNRNKTSSKKSSKINYSTAKPMLAEYYDLPYRYNQTVVKILAQTPTTLFVYWDISDEDRLALISTHGEKFFYETRPILIIHNLTYNYSFEVEINDFANSWYIRTQEPNCNYIIELGRKYNNTQNEYIHIYSSNNMTSPNDHILFENTNLGNVLFKNVKTNTTSSKNFKSLKFINTIDKLYGNIYDVYGSLYNNEIFNELTNPSSGEFYLK